MSLIERTFPEKDHAHVMYNNKNQEAIKYAEYINV